MKLEPRDMDSVLGPIIDEVGCLSPAVKEKIVDQITAQLNRLVNEQIINILIIQGQQLNDKVSSKIKSTIEIASDTLKNEVRQSMSKLEVDVDSIKKSMGIVTEKINTGNARAEGVARLTAGLTRVISGIDQKVSTETGKQVAKNLTRVSSLSKKQPRVEEEKKDSEIKPSKKEIKKTQPISEKTKEDSKATSISEIDKIVFKDIVKMAKDLGVIIKPRMKKIEIINEIKKISKLD